MAATARSRLDRLRGHLPPPNFIVLHYAYFIGTCLIAAIVFWGASTPARSISFTDSLFLAVSAMTEAGLNTVNLSQLNTFQQFILFLMIMLGSSVLVSSATVIVRKRAFEKRFTNIVEDQREKRLARSGTGGLSFVRSFARWQQATQPRDEPSVDGVVRRGKALQGSGQIAQVLSPSYNPGDHPRPEVEREGDSPAAMVKDEEDVDQFSGSRPSAEHMNGDIGGASVRLRGGNGHQGSGGSPVSPRPFTIRFAENESLARRRHSRVLSMSGVGARPDLRNHPKDAQEQDNGLQSARPIADAGDHRRGTAKHYLTGGFIGRNSQFYSLSPAERERLGGVEYRALELLEVIVPLYFVTWQLLGCIGCAAWVAMNAAETALQNGLNPWCILQHPS